MFIYFTTPGAEIQQQTGKETKTQIIYFVNSCYRFCVMSPHTGVPCNPCTARYLC